MKRTLIALSVAAAALAPTAEAAPKVYGKINVGVQSYSDDKSTNAANTNVTGVVSNASRFGIKGEDELTADLSAVYQVEWEVRMDSSNGSVTGASTNTGTVTGATTSSVGSFNDLGARNRFVGLKSATYGQVRAGQFDSALKLAQGEADLFNDYYGDMKQVVTGENRLRNVVAYISPRFEGFEAQLHHQFRDSANDSFVDVNAVPSTATVQGKKGGNSVALTYTNEEAGFYAALAADRGISSKAAVYSKLGTAALGGTEAQRDVNRAVVTYKTGGLFLSALYNTSKLSSASQAALTGTDLTRQREDGYILGAAYNFGDDTVKVEYAKGDAKETNNKSQVSVWQLGVDHAFTSKTKLFAFLTKLKADNSLGATLKDVTVASIGLDHKF